MSAFIRLSSIAVTTALVLLYCGAPGASARPDPGDPIPTPVRPDISFASHCPLRRIGTQLVRCDYLTGAGVAAPAFVEVLRTSGTGLATTDRG